MAIARFSPPPAISTVLPGKVRSAFREASPATSLTSCRMAKTLCRMTVSGRALAGLVHLNRRFKWLSNPDYHTLDLGDLDAETRFRRYNRALKVIRWNLFDHGRSCPIVSRSRQPDKEPPGSMLRGLPIKIGSDSLPDIPNPLRSARYTGHNQHHPTSPVAFVGPATQVYLANLIFLPNVK